MSHVEALHYYSWHLKIGLNNPWVKDLAEGQFLVPDWGMELALHGVGLSYQPPSNSRVAKLCVSLAFLQLVVYHFETHAALQMKRIIRRAICIKALLCMGGQNNSPKRILC